MPEIDLNDLSTPEHGYTVDDEDDDDPTDTDIAPWIVVKSNDKKRARINAIRHLLAKTDYDDKDAEVVGEPDPLIVGRALADWAHMKRQLRLPMPAPARHQRPIFPRRFTPTRCRRRRTIGSFGMPNTVSSLESRTRS